MGAELPIDLYQQILALSGEAEERSDDGDYSAAIRLYREAIRLLPEPVVIWSAAHWLLSSLGDACFWDGDFEGAQAALAEAARCADADENAFIPLRLGQALYELGDERGAAEQFARVFALSGDAPFERGDPKYRDFFRRHRQNTG